MNQENIDTESETEYICKICLLSDKVMIPDLEKKIYIVIPNKSKTSFCRCQKYVHDECLIDWCVMKYTIQCPDCNIFYNLEIKKFIDEKQKDYFYLLNRFSFILLVLGFTAISIFFFASTGSFLPLNQHWALFFGIFFLILCAGIVYFSLNNKSLFIQEKKYVFHIHLLSEENSYLRSKEISKDFEFMLDSIFRLKRGELFNSKIDSSLFFKLDISKRSNLGKATQTLFNKKSKISREVSMNCFVQINHEEGRKNPMNVDFLRKGSVISEKVLRNKPINNLMLLNQSINVDQAKLLKNNRISLENRLKEINPHIAKKVSTVLIKNRNSDLESIDNRSKIKQAKSFFANQEMQSMNEESLLHYKSIQVNSEYEKIFNDNDLDSVISPDKIVGKNMNKSVVHENFNGKTNEALDTSIRRKSDLNSKSIKKIQRFATRAKNKYGF